MSKTTESKTVTKKTVTKKTTPKVSRDGRIYAYVSTEMKTWIGVQARLMADKEKKTVSSMSDFIGKVLLERFNRSKAGSSRK